MRILARLWLAASGAQYHSIRFDVVSVLVGRTVAVQHLRGAF
jgi:Holliday junction resolvase-like predicted endonuclease